MKKQILFILTAVLLSSLFFGCAPAPVEEVKTIEGNVEEILQRIYDGLDTSIKLPFLMNTELSEDMGKENDGIRVSYYLGTTGIPFCEGIASEPAIGGAYSVCLLRMDKDADLAKTIQDIEDNIDPAKWICYRADTVIVDCNCDLVILIMTNDETLQGLGEAIHDSFLNLT